MSVFDATYLVCVQGTYDGVPQIFPHAAVAGEELVGPPPNRNASARWYTWSTNVMASLSNSGLAHPPRSNPPLRFSSGPPFRCSTPSTEAGIQPVVRSGASLQGEVEPRDGSARGYPPIRSCRRPRHSCRIRCAVTGTPARLGSAPTR